MILAARVVLGAGTTSAVGHTFVLEGGYFYGPGPIVPDTELPQGHLTNIHFDPKLLRGYCEFANDGSRSALLSDLKTRVNQNIEAGRLLIGGGTSPVLLTAVDGGPHQGTEQYYFDEQYRFVWRVDIALDPGFEEGIIRLDDFELNTGVVRIGSSLQSRAGQPGGYEQAGSLKTGEYLAGRVGDFNEDGFLDGILVAAPNVPLAADMLPGAPVGNLRGFRTDVPIAPQLSAELMLRGALHMREAIATTLRDSSPGAAPLMRDLAQRVRLAAARAVAAAADEPWRRVPAPAVKRMLEQLERVRVDVTSMSALLDASTAAGQTPTPDFPAQVDRAFDRLKSLTGVLNALNARSGKSLPAPSAARAGAEPAQKNY
ncbi:MAG TPA: hypothetical protein VFU13_03205 [Steroidobacteraceae bacterium]|nr:hypothetical protein [Steroidobacteraceae bacterium]